MPFLFPRIISFLFVISISDPLFASDPFFWPFYRAFSGINQNHFKFSATVKQSLLSRKRKYFAFDKERFFEILDTTPFKGRRALTLGGLGKHLKWLERKIPTPEIICGKIYRILTGLKKTITGIDSGNKL